MSNQSVQYLLDDHRQCAAAVAKLEALLAARAAEASWNAQAGAEFREVCRFFQDHVLTHFRLEEEILYRALEDYLPRDVGPLAVLRGEHRDVLANMKRLCVAGELLAGGKAEPQLLEEFLRAGCAAATILRDHMYKEDRILFPMVARFLSPERDAHLLGQMREMTSEAHAKSAATSEP
jgi:hemerythrin-like domain-containing protein